MHKRAAVFESRSAFGKMRGMAQDTRPHALPDPPCGDIK